MKDVKTPVRLSHEEIDLLMTSKKLGTAECLGLLHLIEQRKLTLDGVMRLLGSTPSRGVEEGVAKRLESVNNSVPLGERGGEKPSVGRHEAGQRIRASTGEITARREFSLPLLESLVELGGSGKVADVLERVYDKVKDRLKPMDLEPLPKGGSVRWKNSVEWLRFRFIRRGYLKKNSAYGIWEISEEGRKLLDDLRSKGTVPKGIDD